ncbi:hypothetical protein D3C81_1779070 [compost metagenome]
MISTNFLTSVAGFTKDRIAKIVLNESVEITEFEIKELSGSTVIMQYMVRSADVSDISKIELQDAEGQVISSNTVNVSIAADTLLLHTIDVTEEG